ncbi:peptidoglycan hydrolase CwlO-like protein [Bacillus fengqiuensis]|nr:peptidoglycan hydrolase CwlO-like protein [Bacillus fengqiuensis]
MKRKVLSVSTAVMIGISSLWPVATQVSANSTLQNKINQVKEQRSTISNGVEENRQEIERLQAEQKKLEQELERLDTVVAETNEKIRVKETEIKKTNEAIESLKKEIQIVTERINKRNELLKARARALQESGGTVDYLEVILDSQSFGDFVSRVSAVSTIVQADKDILKQHEEDKRLKQEKEDELQSQLASLESKLKELESLKKELQQQVEKKNALMGKLEKEEEHKEHEIHQLENEDQLLANQEAAIKAMMAEEARKAEEARQRAAEAAKQSSGSSASKTSSAPSASSMPAVTGGMFMKPANGPITSGYGGRWGKLHAGIDIGKRGGDVPIVAAAGGRVIRSYYSSSYGNCVFITHMINGQVYTTVYAHMENRAVSEGQTVEKGQYLGYMGNTGRSKGAHLHFEIHKGAWNQSKSNSVDPRPYIGG